MRPKTLFAALAVALFALAAAADLEAQQNPLFRSWERHLELEAGSEFGLEWVSVGPVMNGARAACVQGDPTRPGTLYAAFGPGGLWKTTDNGLTWKPVFENQAAPGIGDVALAPSRPETIWLGTGVDLKKPRNFTMPGTGVFRSDDGGTTWRHLGLEDSYHIGKIDVHPTDPDIAFVAVHGHYWTTNPNRGLYRTLDGGATWDHVLYVNERTGANDVDHRPLGSLGRLRHDVGEQSRRIRPIERRVEERGRREDLAPSRRRPAERAEDGPHRPGRVRFRPRQGLCPGRQLEQERDAGRRGLQDDRRRPDLGADPRRRTC